MSSALTDQILDAALLHVAFDGWSDATLNAAIADCNADPTLVHAAFPRGPVDLAMAFHRRGDARMLKILAQTDLNALRYRDRVAFAVRTRLELIEDKEAVRRGTTLFSLPMHAADGARAVWETADHIWNALGDTSQDVNWYTKRATLSGVYSATVLYWLGDHSENHSATWAFLDRRIDDVMQIEKLKGQMRKAPGFGPIMRGVEGMLSRVRPPTRRTDVPGMKTG